MRTRVTPYLPPHPGPWESEVCQERISRCFCLYTAYANKSITESLKLTKSASSEGGTSR